MNARSEFLKATNWEADYSSGNRRDSAIIGYRGPFPTGGKELEVAKATFGPCSTRPRRPSSPA